MSCAFQLFVWQSDKMATKKYPKCKKVYQIFAHNLQSNDSYISPCSGH